MREGHKVNFDGYCVNCDLNMAWFCSQLLTRKEDTEDGIAVLNHILLQYI